MSVSTRNRGMNLERKLDQSCRQYELMKVAKIFKRPVEKKVINGKLKYMSKAGVDYNGTIRGGRAVSFDAKENKKLNLFPLDSVHVHQYEELRDMAELGGIAFLIVSFVELGKMYLLPFDVIERHWTGITKQKRGKGSIPLAIIEAEGIEIKTANGCHVDFIPAIEAYTTKQ